MYPSQSLSRTDSAELYSFFNTHLLSVRYVSSIVLEGGPLVNEIGTVFSFVAAAWWWENQ